MATFKVKPKNKVDIDKKPRVYFTCHPEDFEKCFKKICDDIFKTHDCAIYYTEDMTEVIANDEKQVDLARNNLFVVPVTFKLLTTLNRAMDDDIPYAMKEHIPVLPIMMESGIDEFYSKPDKFGELQYLNPYSTDLSEVSYEEKLKKYLEAVLISKDLAEHVRKAFDAYIFLSYRKKDRKYANELMRLIHSIPECRDIAIWFDEFLTPGESFKENIEKALDDCKLFTLLVTPRLFEKVIDENGEEQDNYVISTELPLARKKKQEKGTNIFAVEMEETDKQALAAISIEDYVNSGDSAFRTRLIDAISRMAITTNDTPEHKFLIGLAYLEGIDVEVDLERGLELIVSAADKDQLEAIDKLVHIYITGTGVTPSYYDAIIWQKRKIFLLKQKYQSYSTEKNFELLCDAIFKGIEMCYNNHDSQQAYQIGVIFEDNMSLKSWKDFNKTTQKQWARSKFWLSKLLLDEGKILEAKKYADEALKCAILLQDDSHESYHLDILLCMGIIALLFYKQHNYIKAEEQLAACINYNLKIKGGRTKNIEYGLWEMYFNLCCVYFDQQKYLEAEEYCKKAKNQIEYIQEHYGENAQTIIFEAMTCTRLSNLELHKKAPDFESAENYCNYAFEKLSKLAPTWSVLEIKALCLSQFGDISCQKKQIKEAIEYYKQSTQIYQNALLQNKNYTITRQLAIIYMRMAEQYILLHKYKEAHSYYNLALDVWKNEVEKKNVDALECLCITYKKIGELYEMLNLHTESKHYYEMEWQHLKELSDLSPNWPTPLRISISFEKHGDIYSKEKKYKIARKYYEAAISIRESWNHRMKNLSEQRILSVLYNKLGNVCKAQNDELSADIYYRKSLQVALLIF